MNKYKKVLKLRQVSDDYIASFEDKLKYLLSLENELGIVIDEEALEYIASLGSLKAANMDGIYARLLYHARVLTYDNHITLEEAKLALR